MPHPRKHMKLTGDTHPPEVEDDFGPQEQGPAQAVPTATAAPGGEDIAAVETRAGGRAMRLAEAGEGYLASAREQVRSRPLTAAFAAFAAGFALAVVTRSR